MVLKSVFYPPPSMKNMVYCVHPCPCGNFGSQKACGCAPAVVTRYQKRISGPLLDRIDIHVEVPSVDCEKLSGDRLSKVGRKHNCVAVFGSERALAHIHASMLNCRYPWWLFLHVPLINPEGLQSSSCV